MAEHRPEVEANRARIRKLQRQAERTPKEEDLLMRMLKFEEEATSGGPFSVPPESPVLAGDAVISREILREVDEMLAQVERIAESDEQAEIDGLVHQLKVLSPNVRAWRNAIQPLIDGGARVFMERI